MSDLRQQLQSEWSRVTGAFPTLDAADITRASASVALDQAATEPSPRRRWPIAVAAALAVLVVIGGPLLVLGRRATSPGDDDAVAATTAPSPQATAAPDPTAVPDDNGVAATSAPSPQATAAPGPAAMDFTWTRIDPAAGDLPPLWDVVTVDWGLLTLADGLLWGSLDGLSWSQQPLPADLERAERVSAGSGSVAVLSGIAADGTVGLWQSGEGGEWLRVEGAERPDAPELPAVTGAEWEWSGWSDATPVGTSLVLQGWARVRLDLGQGAGYGSWDPDSSVLQIVEVPSRSTIATYEISVESTDGAVSIRAVDTESERAEKVIISMPEVDPGTLVDRILTGGLTIDYLAAVSGDDEGHVVVAPWSRPDAFTDVTIRVGDGGAVASVDYFTAYPSTFVSSDGGHERWISEDGISWTREDAPFDLPGGVTITEVAGRLVAQESGPGRAWLATSRTEWFETTIPGSRPDMTAVLPTGFGWVAWAMEGGGDGSEELVVWITSDGELWEQMNLDGLGMRMPPTAGYFGVVAAGDTLFVDRGLGDPPRRTLWVGRFEAGS